MNYQIAFLNSLKDMKHLSDFVKNNHYSKSLARGCDKVFVLYDNIGIKGIAMFGVPVGRNCEKVYAGGAGKLIELKRFVLAPNAEKNLASYFMAKCIKYIKSNYKIHSILSYADPNFGHIGTIYKASNFKYFGTQRFQNRVLRYNKKNYHKRIVYQDTKIGFKLRDLYKKGLAKWKTLKPKHIFVYYMERT